MKRRNTRFVTPRHSTSVEKMSELFRLLGLSRDFRRGYRGGDGQLAATLLFPPYRLRRFWLVGLPQVTGRQPAGSDGLPSVDLAWLRRYFPDFLTAPLVQEQLLGDFPELENLEAELCMRDEVFRDAHFKIDFRPFSVWAKIKSELAKWESLAEDEHRALVEGLVALDGISGGCLFTDHAIALIPHLSDYFEAWNLAGSEASLPVPQEPAPITATAAESIEASPTDLNWVELLTQLVTTVNEALNAPPSTELIERIRHHADRLSACLDTLEQARSIATHCDAALNELAKTIEEAADELEMDWLSHDLLRSVASRWRERIAESRVGIVPTVEAELEAFAAEVRQLLVQLRATFDTRRALAKELDSLIGASKSGSTPSEKKAAIAARAELEQRRNVAEQEAADLEEALERLLTPIGNTESPFSPRPSEPEDNKPVVVEPIVTARPVNLSPAPAPESGNNSRSPNGPLPAAVQVESPTHAPEPGGPAPQPTERSQGDRRKGDGDEPVVTPPTFDEHTGELCRPIWDAIRNNQPALAYQVAKSLGRVAPAVKVPPVALLRALALAGAVETRHGEIAEHLSACYLELNAGDYSDGPQDWRTALNLLLVAATLRPSLIAPTTGATAVIRYAHPKGALHELRQLVVQAGEALQGLNVSRASFLEIKGAADWNARRSALESEITEWHNKASATTINFQAATEVWRRLLSPKNRLGTLVSAIKSFDAKRVDQVRAEVAEIGNPTNFRRLVNEVDRSQLGGRRREEIHARAYEQLRDRAQDLLDLAERWIQLMQQSPESDGFVGRKLRTLMGQIRDLKPQLERELGEACRVGDPWHLIESSVTAVRVAVDDLLALEMAPISEAREPSSGEVLGRCLLWAPTLELDDAWNAPLGADLLLDALRPLTIETPSPQAVLDRHIERGDFKDARRLLALPEVSALRQADSWSHAVDDAAKVAKSRLGQDIDRARSALEGALASGYITEQERGPLDAKLVALSDSLASIDQFGPAHEAVRSVMHDVEKFQAQRIKEAKDQVAQLRLDPQSDAARRLDTALQAGDVFVVYEYLQHVRNGEPLPVEEGGSRDSFREFFPEGAARAEEALKGVTKPQELIEAIRSGRRVLGMDFAPVASAQRVSAAKFASTWFALKRTPNNAVDLQISEILSELGFVSPRSRQAAKTRSGAEFDIQTEPLADRAICPIPAFGSQAGGRYRIVCIWGRPVDEDVPRLIGETGGRATIAFYFGRLSERQRRELARTSRHLRQSFLVLDDVLMLHLCAEPRSRLAAFFATSLPFSAVEPYVATAGLVPPEMFFGRKDELKAITSPSGGCFVYGGRQLGKTALLRAAERNFSRPTEQRYAKWIDLKTEGLGITRSVGEIWSVLHREVQRFGSAFERIQGPKASRRSAVDDFLHELRAQFEPSKGRRLLLLLDEADAFLEQDSRSSFEETQRLKNLMEATDRNVKVVFAGLHNVLRVTEQANHPLAHLGDPIEVGPLTRPGEGAEARSMIIGPLKAAGYELASAELATRVLAQTNYYPVLIQLYCEELIRLLHGNNGRRPDPPTGPRFMVTSQTIDDTYRNKSLRDAIRLRLQYTLQLDSRYEVIAYALAFAVLAEEASASAGVDPAEIKRWATFWWPEGFGGTSEHEFRILLDEMVGLGVLRHDGPREYGMRNPNVLRLLGTGKDIEDVLDKKREPPPEFAPSVFHSPLPSAGVHHQRRSPITYTQESELVRPANVVSIISGVGAAGLFDLQEFLTSLNVDLTWGDKAIDLQSFRKAISRMSEKRKEGTSVLVIPTDVPWTETWIAEALEKVGNLKSKERHLRIVFVADPSLLRHFVPALSRLQAKGVELNSLRPWTDMFVQRWLEDMQMVGSSPASRAQLQKVSGYWPTLLYRIPSHCHEIQQLTDSIEGAFSSEGSIAELRSEFGLESSAARQALRLVADFEGEPIDALRDLASDTDYEGVTSEALQDWIEWAETLQLIHLQGRGWRVDPVVRRLVS